MELSVAMQIPGSDGRNIKLCKDKGVIAAIQGCAPAHAWDFILAAASPTFRVTP